VKPASTPRRLVQTKKTWRDTLPTDMLLSAVSVLAVAQPSSEVPEGLMNNPVFVRSLISINLRKLQPVSRIPEVHQTLKIMIKINTINIKK
jgi:hypothetical protein